jgi:hypothetical protein
MKKDALLRAVDQLPEEFRIDDLIERLIIVQKVEEAEQSLDAGRGITHADVAKQLRETLKEKRDGGNTMVA